MSKPHKIEVEGLVSWLNEAQIMYASSSRERKKLFADTKGNLIITIAGYHVWTGTSPEDAVEIYNAITEEKIHL